MRLWFESLNCGRITGINPDGSFVLCSQKHGHRDECSPRPAAADPLPASASTFNRDNFRALCAERWRA